MQPIENSHSSLQRNLLFVGHKPYMAQCFYSHHEFVTTTGETLWIEKRLEKKRPNWSVQMTLAEKASQLRYDAPAIKRLGIPAYNWWNEALHGVARAGQATIFPQAIGLGATFDTELLEEIADVTATEGRAKYNAYSQEEDRDIYKGLTFWSPNVNIFPRSKMGTGT